MEAKPRPARKPMLVDMIRTMGGGLNYFGGRVKDRGGGDEVWQLKTEGRLQ